MDDPPSTRIFYIRPHLRLTGDFALYLHFSRLGMVGISLNGIDIWSGIFCNKQNYRKLATTPNYR